MLPFYTNRADIMASGATCKRVSAKRSCRVATTLIERNLLSVFDGGGSTKP